MFSKINVLLLLSIFSFACCVWAVEFPELETAIIQQDYTKARSLAQDLLKNAPLPTDERNHAKYYLALSFLQLDQYEEAKSIFKELIRGKIDDSLRDKSYLGLFDSYYSPGDYKQAKETIEKLIDQSPSSEFLSLIYLKAARANLKLANWNQANKYLDKIIKDFPQSFEYHIAKQLLEEKQYFTVQVGSFIDQNLAQSLTDKLKNEFDYVYMVETIDRDQEKFYRVRVGEFTLFKEAQKLEEKLSQLGYPAQIYP